MITNSVIDRVVMILGDSKVGKTSLISNFVEFENIIDLIERPHILKDKEKTICNF
jgi:GTPase SAR1 family protein